MKLYLLKSPSGLFGYSCHAHDVVNISDQDIAELMIDKKYARTATEDDVKLYESSGKKVLSYGGSLNTDKGSQRKKKDSPPSAPASRRVGAKKSRIS